MLILSEWHGEFTGYGSLQLHASSLVLVVEHNIQVLCRVPNWFLFLLVCRETVVLLFSFLLLLYSFSLLPLPPLRNGQSNRLFLLGCIRQR